MRRSRRMTDDVIAQFGRRSGDTDKPYQCKECIYKAKFLKDVERHYRQVHDSSPTTCEICGRKYKNKTAVYDHKRECHPEIKVCNRCGMSLEDNEKLAEHKRTCRHDKNGKEDCTKLVEPVPVQDNFHIERMPDKSYKCGLCGLKSIYERSIRSHISRVHVNDPRTCEICNLELRNPMTYEQHKQLKHSGQVECVTCNQTFTCKALLKRHRVTCKSGIDNKDLNIPKKSVSNTRKKVKTHTKRKNVEKRSVDATGNRYRETSPTDNNEKGPMPVDESDCMESNDTHLSTNDETSDQMEPLEKGSLLVARYMRFEDNKWKCAICNYVIITQPKFIEHFNKKHVVDHLSHNAESSTTEKAAQTSDQMPTCSKYVVMNQTKSKGSGSTKRPLNSKCNSTMGRFLRLNKKRSGRYVERSNDTKSPWKCKLCSKTSTNYYAAILHSRLHIHNPIKCSKCNVACRNEIVLKAHELRNHSGPCQCVYCKKMFPKYTKLAYHLKICAQRGKRPPRRKDGPLGKYIAPSKNKNKPWKCIECGFEAVSDFHIMRHAESVHVQDSQTCKKCGKIFKNPCRLQNHLEQSHSSERHCGACGKTFKNNGTFRNKSHTKYCSGIGSSPTNVEEDVTYVAGDLKIFPTVKSLNEISLVVSSIYAWYMSHDGQLNDISASDPLYKTVARLCKMNCCGGCENGLLVGEDDREVISDHETCLQRIIDHALIHHNKYNISSDQLYLAPVIINANNCPICEIQYTNSTQSHQEHVNMHIAISRRYNLSTFDRNAFTEFVNDRPSPYEAAIFCKDRLHHAISNNQLVMLIYLPFHADNLKGALNRLRNRQDTSICRIPVYLTDEENIHHRNRINFFTNATNFYVLKCHVRHPIQETFAPNEKTFRRMFAKVYLFVFAHLHRAQNNTNIPNVKFYMVGNRSHSQRLERCINWVNEGDIREMFTNVFNPDTTLICPFEILGQECDDQNCGSIIHSIGSMLWRNPTRRSENVQFTEYAVEPLRLSSFFNDVESDSSRIDQYIIETIEALKYEQKKNQFHFVYVLIATNQDELVPQPNEDRAVVGRGQRELTTALYKLYVGRSVFKGYSKNHDRNENRTSYQKLITQGFQYPHLLYNMELLYHNAEIVEGLVQLASVVYDAYESHEKTKYHIVNERIEWKQLGLAEFGDFHDFFEVAMGEFGFIYDMQPTQCTRHVRIFQRNMIVPDSMKIQVSFPRELVEVNNENLQVNSEESDDD